MKEYLKIKNIFLFDEKYRTVVGLDETMQTLKNITWEGTEKVDGTNVRVHWDGHRIEFAGRTDKAELPKELKEALSNIFLT